MDGGVGIYPPSEAVKLFNACCPHYMAMGMSYDEFWYGEPERVLHYQKSNEIKRAERNYDLWLQGLYFHRAINVSLGHALSKDYKGEYPSEPYPLTEAEQIAHKEREEAKRLEEFKAKIDAFNEAFKKKKQEEENERSNGQNIYQD